jgi:damage-control phosphatase, subfamily I
MKASADCIACMFRQGLNAARLVSDDPAIHLEVMKELARHVAGLSVLGNPAVASQPAYEVASAVTGVADPYAEIKRETNRAAMAVAEDIRRVIASSGDPLDAALHAAAAGNVIDLGIGHEFDIEKDIEAFMHRDFAFSAIDDFRDELGPGRKLLYLGDNAGEIVFDALLVEQLLAGGTEVTFTVKSGPIINDATMEDAESTGMTSLVPVLETGSADIGIHWERCSDAFRSAFEMADVIVAKGHGNFETCNARPENVYFLLKAKCELVAKEIGCALGDIVFLHSPA